VQRSIALTACLYFKLNPRVILKTLWLLVILEAEQLAFGTIVEVIAS
jgi:hypothetical protein